VCYGALCFESSYFSLACRVSTEINFVIISIRIQIEINLDFLWNYWSKLLKVIGISITTVGIEILISNRHRNFDLRFAMLWNLDIDIKICYQNGNQNSDAGIWNSDSKVKIIIEIAMSKSKSKFWTSKHL
jgi:hypothetical protein